MSGLDTLRKEVAVAFAAASPPLPDRIAEDTDWDAGDITESFKAFLDAPVTDEVLKNHAKSLPGLAPEAFVFFLKDYLSYGIANPTTEVAENLIYRLSSTDPANPYWRERLKLMSLAQKQAVINCCSYLLEQATEGVLRRSLEDALRVWSLEATESN